MSTHLVTTVVSEDIEIGVFSNLEEINDEIGGIFEKNGYRVSKSPIKNNKKLGNFYKTVVFLRDFEEIVKNTTDVEKIISNSDNCLVIISTFTGIGQGKKWDDWVRKSHQQQEEIKKFINSHPNLTIFLATDLLTDLEVKKHPFFKRNIEDFGKGQFFDPCINFYFQNPRDLVKNISHILLSPWKKEVLQIKGDENSSEYFIKKISNKIKDSLGEWQKVVKYPAIELIQDIGKKITINVNGENVEKKIFNIFKPEISNAIFKQNNIRKLNQIKFEEKKQEKLVQNNVVLRVGSESLLFEKNIKKVNPTEKINKKIDQVFKLSELEEKKERIKKTSKKTQKIQKKNWRKKIFFLIGLIFSSLSLLMILFYFSTRVISRSVENQLYTTVIDSLKTNKYKVGGLGILEKKISLLKLQVSFYEFLLPQNQFQEIVSVIDVGEEFISFFDNFLELREHANIVLSDILGITSGDPFLSLEKLQLKNSRNYRLLSSIQSRTTEFSDDENLQKQITLLRKKMSSYQQLSSILPQIIGEDGRKTYVVLLQDNLELRPTGGFISSVGLLTFFQGSLVETEVIPVYQLDAKDIGKISPPPEIERFFGENRLYIHDANWDPDFPTSAKKILKMISRASNREIDGIIAINLNTISEIIAQTGPIELSEYNETLTDKNIFERAEFHSEIELVGDAGRENYLDNVFQKVFEKFYFVADNQRGLSFLNALYSSMNDNQVLFYFSDESIQKTFSLMGLTGEVFTPPCPSQFEKNECIVDSFFQVDSNVGVNKADFSLEKQLQHSIKISSNSIDHKRQIVYRNQAKSKSWPQGEYRDYIRFFLPAGVKNIGVSVDGKKIDEEKYIIESFGNRSVLSLYLEIPIQSERIVQVSFSSPPPQNNKFGYLFFDQQQSGSEFTSKKIEVSYSDKFTPKTIFPEALLLQQKIIFTTEKFSHSYVGVGF